MRLFLKHKKKGVMSDFESFSIRLTIGKVRISGIGLES